MRLRALADITTPYAVAPADRHPLLEVVDAGNAPVCLLRAADVQRQGLPHRAVALLLRDKNGRALLTHWPERGWGVSAYARATAGQAFEDCARALLLEAGLDPTGRVRPLGLAPPCPESRNAFVAFFEARLPLSLAMAGARNAERHLLADYDELRGMAAHFGELLSPLLRVAVQAGYVRPR
ncbi:NUDIX hydrolase [Desulfovibrio legallii]|uniref:NUDIX hydrolase n=1 Tax=Desulfovibrio legallii TaxID=571438 RepID=A0A1G7KK00_9BACT|nr:NUDIX hydrolase [Desulfovibrio legallii]SDF37588.1 hypothetical protein SAMN05192586_104142 [Desulfovibrio legallii]